MAKKKATKTKVVKEVVKTDGGTTHNCPQGYSWNGKECTPNVGI